MPESEWREWVVWDAPAGGNIYQIMGHCKALSGGTPECVQRRTDLLRPAHFWLPVRRLQASEFRALKALIHQANHTAIGFIAHDSPGGLHNTHHRRLPVGNDLTKLRIIIACKVLCSAGYSLNRSISLTMPCWGSLL